MHRTRIKICGLTRVEDVRAASEAGADAIGLVFYAPSPRHVSIEQAQVLARAVPPFVTRTGLFVNASVAEVDAVLAQVPLELLQFHGDETPAFCAQFKRPWVKAARVRPGLDLLEFAAFFGGAAGCQGARCQGILLDAFVDGFGGGGKTFDWSLIPTPPAQWPLPLVLSGGLDADNVAQAIQTVQPWAVDVSSGVEASPGIKDAAKIAAFVAAARKADGCK